MSALETPGSTGKCNSAATRDHILLTLRHGLPEKYEAQELKERATPGCKQTVRFLMVEAGEPTSRSNHDDASTSEMVQTHQPEACANKHISMFKHNSRDKQTHMKQRTSNLYIYIYTNLYREIHTHISCLHKNIPMHTYMNVYKYIYTYIYIYICCQKREVDKAN